MTEEEQTDVNTQEAVDLENQPSESQGAEAPSLPDKDYNWRRMEKKMSELERQNQELKNSLTQKPVENVASTDEDSELDEDDLLTVRQANKLAETRARKIVEEELSKREKAQLPAKAKLKYSDYDSIVTPENIEYLLKEDPDLEHDLQVAKNPYERVYKEIKRAEFFRAKQQGNVAEKRMEENTSKPMSSNSLGKQRPLSQANAYAKGSPELWEEMQKYGRGGY